MRRVIFIILAVIAGIIVSQLKKSGSRVDISNVQGVSCLGGTYHAVMASRGGRVEQIELSESSGNITFSVAPAGTGYSVTYASRGSGGERNLHEESVPSGVYVLDPDHGLKSVTYSDSLAELGEKIRNRESLSISVGP